MKFAGICLVSDDVIRLGEFYSELLGIRKTGDENHTYFEFGHTHISICPRTLEEKIAPGSMVEVSKHNNIIEFGVEEIDELYEQLLSKNHEIVKTIKTESWGIRSFWIRDPDGNIVNLCCRAD